MMKQTAIFSSKEDFKLAFEFRQRQRMKDMIGMSPFTVYFLLFYS